MVQRVVDAPVARSSDPVTSFEAGESPTAREASEFAVLHALRAVALPMSDYDVLEYVRTFDPSAKWTEQRLRTARKQLVKKALVVDAGIREGASATGRRAHVWQAAA